MKKNNGIRSLVGILVIALLGGCSAVKNMESMKKTTEDMNQTTKDMNYSAKALTVLTKEMLESMAALYLPGLQSGGEDVRSRNIANLENAQTKYLRNMNAGHFFVAFEYNYWKLRASDNQANLNAYLETAAKDFLLIVNNYLEQLPQNEEILIKAWPERAQYAAPRANLFAFLIAMHTTNPIHEKIRESYPEVEPISMESLLENGLRLVTKMNKGEINVNDLPPYAYVISKNFKVAIKALQYRHNLLLGYAMEKLPGFKKLGGLDKWYYANWHYDQDSDRWDPELYNLETSGNLKEINLALQMSQSLKEFLLEIDEILRYDSNALHVFGNIKSSPYKNEKDLAENKPPRLLADQVKTFYQLVDLQWSEFIQPRVEPLTTIQPAE